MDESHGSNKPEIVICARHFPPAYHSGGPPRSLGGLVQGLKEDFNFRVLTMANDRTSTDVMPGITPDIWSSWGPAKVRYGTNPWRVMVETARACRGTGARVIYLNSFFDVHFTLLPLAAVKLTSPRTPIVLAPRGEFSPGALSLKPLRKRVYQALVRRSGLTRDVRWQASTGDELVDIQRQVGASVKIGIARDMREVPQLSAGNGQRSRQGTFRIIFLSRITRMKNLDGLIRALSECQDDDLSLTIAGPVVDERYWGECQRLVTHLGLDSRISYVGAVHPDEVVPYLGEFDLFALPTLGENFGHVVLEALLAGTPVLVGSGAPWGSVSEQRAGLVVDVRAPRAIASAIDEMAALTPAAHLTMCQQARALGERHLDDDDVVTSNVELFQSAFGCGDMTPQGTPSPGGTIDRRST